MSRLDKAGKIDPPGAYKVFEQKGQVIIKGEILENGDYTKLL